MLLARFCIGKDYEHFVELLKLGGSDLDKDCGLNTRAPQGCQGPG